MFISNMVFLGSLIAIPIILLQTVIAGILFVSNQMRAKKGNLKWTSLCFFSNLIVLLAANSFN